MKGEDRLPSISKDRMTEEQRRYVEEIERGPRGALLPPFVPLLRSPELMQHAQRMGEYLRYRGALGRRLSELAILITAREWSQQVEWAIHAPIAEREGIDSETVRAIARGQRPENLPADEQLVYDFVSELQRTQQVSDVIWKKAIDRLGEQGSVDLIGLVGYYTFLSMVMNAARTPAPPSTAQPLPPA